MSKVRNVMSKLLFLVLIDLFNNLNRHAATINHRNRVV